jgi:hypothetical protein
MVIEELKRMWTEAFEVQFDVLSRRECREIEATTKIIRVVGAAAEFRTWYLPNVD